MDLNLYDFYSTWIGGLLQMIRAVQQFLFSPISTWFDIFPDFSGLGMFGNLLDSVFPGFMSMNLASVILGGGIIVLLVWRLVIFILDIVF